MKRTARHDPSLAAHIVARHPLRYADGADARLDRPAHVRAGSSLAWIGDRLVIIQDDANFVALVAPDTGLVHSVPLPRGKGGLRQFGDERGNKKFKLDLEACCTVPGPKGPRLLAFGSGSKKRRRNVLVADALDSRTPRTTVVDATALYLVLEAAAEFAGSDMNIEGVMVHGDRLRLLGRGNGKARDGKHPIDASCELDLGALGAWLDHPRDLAPPQPEGIVQYGLGTLDGVALGFTDGAIHGNRMVFTASAENSADASDDGHVTGSVIGVVPTRGTLRYARITQGGKPTRDKVEGIALSPSDPRQAWMVIDADDHARPSELCEVRLKGPWGLT